MNGVSIAIGAAAIFGIAFLSAAALLRRGMRRGSTSEERARPMPGDEYLEGGPRNRVALTRAVSIGAPPERVWPWLGQLGRGAGWYSVDRLDNGGKTSARHVVSWIPEAELGDASAIGYLRHLSPGRSLAWWVGDTGFVGARCRLVTAYGLSAQESGTRVVARMSADARGPTAPIALLVFRVVDSIMACRQLTGLRDRVEASDDPGTGPRDPESGSRDQYQLYEVLYANGERAGVPGKEHAGRWRRAALDDGILGSRE